MFLQNYPNPQDKFYTRSSNNESNRRKSNRIKKVKNSVIINKQHSSNLLNRTTSTNENFFNLHSATSLKMPQLDAVIIRNLTYEIGRGEGRRVILNKINLTVPEGSIYGLLGPSGCGKTTMLRCVVGRIKALSGSVLVFGFKPGNGISEVPGRDVGYMPQEISIYEDFTIEETLQYFGKINRMHSSDIKKRIQFLLQFLDLPSKKRLVVNLSGGQKRRVSLAAALVHSPPLLILDEPTVGVDPLLRQSIWKHLVTLTQTERISVIITTHYIEEARQANVVGLMRHGKILAENSPDELMRIHQLTNLEDVFLKLCMTDSSKRAASLAGGGENNNLTFITNNNQQQLSSSDRFFSKYEQELTKRASARILNDPTLINDYAHRWSSLKNKQQQQQQQIVEKQKVTKLANDNLAYHEDKFDNYRINNKAKHRVNSLNVADDDADDSFDDNDGRRKSNRKRVLVVSNTNKNNNNDSTKRKNFSTTISGLNRSQLNEVVAGYSKSNKNDFNVNEQEHIENFSSENDDGDNSLKHNNEISTTTTTTTSDSDLNSDLKPNFRKLINQASRHNGLDDEERKHKNLLNSTTAPATSSDESMSDLYSDDYITMQAVKWAARRNNTLNLMTLHKNIGFNSNRWPSHSANTASSFGSKKFRNPSNNKLIQWWTTLMAVTWKNYIRLRRNPPVLVFQFMLPAIQVILFCLCIGGDPFDVPVAIVNDELVPRSSQQFLNGLDKRIIRQIKYENLTSAIEAVKRGTVWGAIHIPDKYSENLQSRLIMGEEVSNATISNGTIRVYPDLTNLHLALALETTFRETFLNFARDSLEEMGYDRSLADLPIQIGKPVYGTLKKDGYLEFMAPGVVISISYVMATGLTALAFILERRDGLLERSLVSGVQTSQILLAHAINQIVVMIIQIFLVLACTFFVFEIPSRGPFFWVVLLILLQGCTGMGFGLLVSAICKEENTAVMMVVGTFYTNLILAGIIWPIEAMPHWLRPVSYAQPQTLPTDTLRHILSRGWGITESGVLLGFAVTIGWLVIFLMAAGIIFKYSR